jgi:hypothetical protein
LSAGRKSRVNFLFGAGCQDTHSLPTGPQLPLLRRAQVRFGSWAGDVTTDKIGRQRRQSIELTFRPTKSDRNVPALDIAGFVPALAERGNERRPLCRRHAEEKPDHRYRRCLRATGERRDEDDARKTTDERSPIHDCLASPTNAGPAARGPAPGQQPKVGGVSPRPPLQSSVRFGGQGATAALGRSPPPTKPISMAAVAALPPLAASN